MQKDDDKLQKKLKPPGKENPEGLKSSHDQLAHEIRGAFIEQQSNIANEINNSINAEHVREKNES